MKSKDTEEKISNVMDGRESFDAKIGNTLVAFINRNSVAYSTEAGGVKFDLVPVTKKKDLMVNAARLYAQQEYNRIMELVSVLQKQAEDLRRRLDITDLVHAAYYQMELYHGNCYWLAYDTEKERSILVSSGPNDWMTGAPANWQYICRIKWLGDNTWMEVDENGEFIG